MAIFYINLLVDNTVVVRCRHGYQIAKKVALTKNKKPALEPRISQNSRDENNKKLLIINVEKEEELYLDEIVATEVEWMKLPVPPILTQQML